MSLGGGHRSLEAMTLDLSDPDLLRHLAYLDGDWTGAGGGATFAVTDPATGATLAEVADCGVAEARAAIDAAGRALPDWKGRTATQRSAVLRRWYELVVEHTDDLALLMTSEQGKPLAEARGEVSYGASFLEWFAEEAKRADGRVIPSPWAESRVLVLRQAIGVVSTITPWNFPIAMLTRKVGPALAAGCTVVSKPASATPLCALALAELAGRAGVPAGVFNVVPTTDASGVGEELSTNPTVRKVSFTGSTAVGKALMAQAAGTIKKVGLELGGNAPFLVFDDADLDAAVAGAMASKYRNGGQTCVCANRILVQESVADEFTERLVAATERLVVGPGTQDGVDIGPLIDEDGIEKVERLVAAAVDDGAEVRTGGSRHPLGGTFYTPTVLSGVTQDMDLARDEIFGPVSPVYRFGDDAEGVAMANDTPYGLASYFYARDVGRIMRVAEALEYGIVGVNEGIISSAVVPFGGVKESGLGREGSHDGLDEVLETKYVLLGGLGAPET
jgi:succinate-semialdehyde dehydrogenase / glutarate-semialdehyde dehydrogenase